MAMALLGVFVFDDVLVEVTELGAWPVPLDLDDHILLVLLHLVPLTGLVEQCTSRVFSMLDIE